MTPMVVREFVVRLRHDSGHVNIWVHSSGVRSGVRAVLTAEHAPERAVVWVKVRPTCKHCATPGVRYVKDSGDATPLCKAHASERYGTSVQVRAQTGHLGIQRFTDVDADEWKG
jgi:hypothetical protein